LVTGLQGITRSIPINFLTCKLDTFPAAKDSKGEGISQLQYADKMTGFQYFETFYMPPDTIIVLNNGEKLDLPDSFFGSTIYEPRQIRYSDDTNKNSGNKGVVIYLFLLVSCMVYLLVRAIRQLPESWSAKRISSEGKKLLDQKGIQYHEWLSKYNPYYSSLSKRGQERFLTRTAIFRQSKEFVYHSMEAEDIIPVLISGAAVQMTFGLKNFLMDYFSVIHVIKKEYHIPQDKDTYYGHVSLGGIHISWNHFLEGYEDYSDAINVGLHEMAHAVSYDVFLGHEDMHDRRFKERLEEFCREGRPVFRAMRMGDNHLLDEYATTNFDEFWAVCAETFFENPVSFKEDMPDLYREISELLNQDPLLPEKIIDLAIA
jgi:MtfA peptidase